MPLSRQQCLVLPDHRYSSSRMWLPACRRHMPGRRQMPSRARNRRYLPRGRHCWMPVLGAGLNSWTQQTNSASSAWSVICFPGWRVSSGRLTPRRGPGKWWGGSSRQLHSMPGEAGRQGCCPGSSSPEGHLRRIPEWLRFWEDQPARGESHSACPAGTVTTVNSHIQSWPDPRLLLLPPVPAYGAILLKLRLELIIHERRGSGP